MIVVMPMAGRGARMVDGGYAWPKPLIQVAGQPMFAWALRSLDGISYRRLIVIALAEHEAAYGITGIVHQYAGAETEVILLNEVTEGQLCTVLAARDTLDCPEDVLITSSDTYIVSNLGDDIAQRVEATRGIISVANMPGDRWSFARTDGSRRVLEVAEKVRISDHASTGLYYFSDGHEFVAMADEMVRKQEKTRGEYYVIPVYRKYLEHGWRVEVSEAQNMWDLGTPEALTAFESHLGSY